MRRTQIRTLAFVLMAGFGPALAQQLPVTRRHEGPATMPFSFGQTVANVGDVDQDMVEDYLVGSPEETLGNPSTPQLQGVVRLYSGASGAVIHTLTGLFAMDRFGRSVGGGGDIDGDGIPDLIVGLPSGQNTPITGHVRTYSGATGTLIWARTLGFLDGYRVANAGDMNGDGYADVATSTGAFTVPASPVPPTVTVLSGLSTSVLHTITGASVGVTSNNSAFGTSLAGGNDFNQDGVGDLIVGFSTYAGIAGQTGAVIVYSGTNAGVLFVLAGLPLSALGWSVATMGDVDGDGIPEVVAGGGGDAVAGTPGRVRVFSGMTGAPLHTLTAGFAGDGFGLAVAGGADLDGDGVPDFATSAPEANPSGPPAPGAAAVGVVRAYSGATGAPIGAYAGPAPGANVGTALAMLRDWNGDGFGEVLVGSSRDETAAMADGGSAQLVQLVGHLAFGAGNGPLQLAFLNGPPGSLSAGLLFAHGALPFAAGFVAADLAGGNIAFGPQPIPVFLGLTPALVIQSVGFDAAGHWGLGMNLRQPALSGTVVFVQAFEGSPPGLVIASAGLQLLFGN